MIGCDRAEGGVEEGGTELRGDVALAGAGLGHRACDAAAAAELGINGKSFGRSGRIVRSLRDGGGGAGGGQDRSGRVGGSEQAGGGGQRRARAETASWPGARGPAGSGVGERRGPWTAALQLPSAATRAAPPSSFALLAPRASVPAPPSFGPPWLFERRSPPFLTRLPGPSWASWLGLLPLLWEHHLWPGILAHSSDLFLHLSVMSPSPPLYLALLRELASGSLSLPPAFTFHPCPLSLCSLQLCPMLPGHPQYYSSPFFSLGCYFEAFFGPVLAIPVCLSFTYPGYLLFLAHLISSISALSSTFLSFPSRFLAFSWGRSVSSTLYSAFT